MNNNFNLKDIFLNSRGEAEIQSLLNNDVYKFTMLDFILAQEDLKNVVVKRKMTIRSENVNTASVIPYNDLINQLELTKKIKGLKLEEYEYLKNLKLSSGRNMFRDETLDFLNNFTLSDYSVGIDDNDNYELEFTGTWAESMLWEIFGLKIINSLYLENYIKKDGLNDEQITQIINKTLARLHNDIEIFKQDPRLTFTEFGTRRAMSSDFQNMVYDILQEKLPNQCIGTSNVALAMKHGQTPIGTNAHELRMIPTALHDDPQTIIDTMYDIDRRWAKHYSELAVLLPDTYTTSFYYDNCPKDIFETHTGTRFDSKDPLVAVPEYVDWALKNGGDPMSKAGIPSDGLDANSALEVFEKHNTKVGRLTFGIGTNLTNNTKGTYPIEEKHGSFGSFSVVIKPAYVQRLDGTWVSCVKLSDNPDKAVGDYDRVELFKNIFGVAGVEKREILV